MILSYTSREFPPLHLEELSDEDAMVLAFYKAHNRYPTPEELRIIMTDSAPRGAEPGVYEDDEPPPDEDGDAFEDEDSFDPEGSVAEDETNVTQGDDLPIDITDSLSPERLEQLERRHRVTISGLSVQFTQKPYGNQSYSTIVVRGEILANGGEQLEQNVRVMALAYDARGRVVATKSAWFDSETFYAMDAFEIELEVYAMPARLRIYPKAA